MDGKLKFIGFMPNIIECCTFIPDRFKGHTSIINRTLHTLCTPAIISALFFSSSFPDLSTGLVAGSFTLHIAGHLIEGILN